MSECTKYARVTTVADANKNLDAIIEAMRHEVKRGTSLATLLQLAIEHARDNGLCENTGSLLVACERLLRAEQEITVKE